MSLHTGVGGRIPVGARRSGDSKLRSTGVPTTYRMLTGTHNIKTITVRRVGGIAAERFDNCSQAVQFGNRLLKGTSMRTTCATIAIATLLVPALAVAQKVSYDYDKGA